MPIKGQFSTQQFNELYGQIISLPGDPSNQDETSNTGYTLTDAFRYFDLTTMTNDLKARTIFWSRFLLCEILQPYDSNLSYSTLALVLRPRALWLFDDGGSNVRDFLGNVADVATLQTAGNGLLTEVAPMYNVGDFIRIGTLPAPITINGWTDNFYKRAHDTYPDLLDRDTSLVLAGIVVNGDTYLNDKGARSRYGNINFTEVVYYDKNVDARERFTSSSDGSTVDVNVCIGGVVHVYRLKGSLLS